MMTLDRNTDFDDWIVETFEKVGSFTMLVVLVEIGETTVTPTASSYLHIIGDETRWPDMIKLLAQSGVTWNGAAFYQADRSGLIEDAEAKKRLGALARHLKGDRSLLAHSDFFNGQGLRLQIEELKKH